MNSTGNPTYQEIVDNALLELNDSRGGGISDRMFINWINACSQNICTAMVVEDSADLDLKAAQEDYVFGVDIPLEMTELYFIDRLEESFHREVLVVDLDILLRKRIDDLVPVYTNYDRPYMCAIYKHEGKRILKVYDVPDADKTVTLYGRIIVSPRLHADDDLTDTIALSETYEPLIHAYLLYKLNQYIKVPEEEQKWYGFYMQGLTVAKHEIRRNKYIRMVYD